jgi:hypothetical protein
MTTLHQYQQWVIQRLARWGESEILSIEDQNVVAAAFERCLGSLTACEMVLNHRRAQALGLEVL